MEKEKFVDGILEAMAPELSPAALRKLEAVLVTHLQDIRLEVECREIVVSDRHWERVLRTWLATKRLENCSEGTLANYGRAIRIMLERLNRRLRNITTSDLRCYLATYQAERQVSLGYMETMRHMISSFFGWLTDEGYIDRDPSRRLRRIKVPEVIKKPYSAAEMEALKRHAANQRDLALLEIMYSTGARIGEIVALNRDQINLVGRDVVIYGQKGKKERYVYLTESCCYHLRRYLDSRQDDNPALFVGSRAPCRRLTKSAVQAMLRKLGAVTGVDHVHPHRFRRTLATDALERGVPIEQVQEILGHSKIETTRIYCTVTEEAVRSSFRRFIA